VFEISRFAFTQILCQNHGKCKISLDSCFFVVVLSIFMLLFLKVAICEPKTLIPY